MGIAGIAMLGMIYCFFKSIASIVNFFIWKSKVTTIGIIKNLKEIEEKVDNDEIKSNDYTYLMSIEYNETTYFVDYKEKIYGNKKGSIEPNSTIPVFVDLDKKLARNIITMKKQISQWLLSFVLCLVVFIICLLFSLALKK